MNDMVNFGGGNLPVDSDDLIAGLAGLSESLSQGATSGIPILRIGKQGIFVYGQDDVEVQPGSEWAINPQSIMHGWACWGQDGEGLIDEVYVPGNTPAPNRNDLQAHGAPWTQAFKVIMQCLNGEDEGQVVEYKTNSVGGRDFFRELVRDLTAQGMAEKKKHPKDGAARSIVPVIIHEVSQYKHPKWGLTNKPVLNIVRWTTMSSPGESQSEPEEKPDKPKAAKQPRKPVKAVENKTDEPPESDDSDEAPPAKTRRRRAV